MAINIRFDLVGNPEPPTIILSNRNGNKLGQLHVEANSIEVCDKLVDASEFSFTLNKYVDGKLTNLWDKVVDFKLVYCKEWDSWFEIKVELNEEIEVTKIVTCTLLSKAELSQIMLYNIEINTEEDIERDDYKISILYDENDPKASILDRVLEKAPHYSIAHVDPTIARIQRSFSFDGDSIDDSFQKIGEEIGCLFKCPSNSDEGGKIQRKIFVYDLQQNCNDCGHRGEFTDVCPKCGSNNIKYGYGEDTLIFVTSDELASSGIQLVTDVDSVKNCFKLEAGDDLMTATIRNCNPNGSDYIWRFSDDIKEDMSDELANKINSYDALYKQHYNNSVSNIDANLLSKYNSLVNKYSVYNKDLQTISSPLTGYHALMNADYNAIDLDLYLKSGLMPSVEMSETSATEQAKLLTSSSLSSVAVANIDVASLATINSAVLAMAKIIIKSTYKIQVNSSELSGSGNTKTWKGNFVVTNYSDEEDTAVSEIVSVKVNGDLETFIRQKLDKALNKENTDDLSISGLFKKEHNDFCEELKRYALNPLISFRDACQACIDILIEQGVGNGDTWGDTEEGAESNLYEKLYVPYYNKLMAIEAEISVRENEIAIISGVYDLDGKLINEGLKANIEKCVSDIQSILNFEKYLGNDLWLEFCSYRREDKYSNDNYVSDGLNNAELFKRALEFFEVAENEIYKASELQCSISTTLNNLLAIPKFKSLVKSFKTGNWIRVQIDDKIYKLRLIEYSIDYGDFNNINVDFSDVTKIKNGITDLQDVISQSSSMATSYSSVQRQAKQGDAAQETIDKWISGGLNSALVQIQSNDTEDITFTKNGLLCRSYDDITESYSPEQLKLTHNIMAYTDDNWETVRQAIGKHDYVLFDKNENRFIETTGYGMNADFVTAGVVSGSQIIGGDIYSDNYSKTDNTGSYLNLRDGTFSFGGGSLRFEGGKLLISSPDIPTTDTITEINEQYLKTTSVYAENLQINSANITGSLTIGQLPDGIANIGDIPTKVSQLTNDSGYQTETGVTTIVGGVVTTDYVNALGIKAGSVDAENITGTTITGKSINGGYLLIGNKNNTYAEIAESGILSCKGANITGNISIKDGDSVKISAGDSDDSFINFGEAFAVSKGGVTAETGSFKSLKVNGQDVLTADNLGYKIVVSSAQPSGNGIIWLKPSADSIAASIEYSGNTPSSRNDSAYLGNSNIAKSFSVNCNDSSENAVFSGNSTFRYKIRFPVILADSNAGNLYNVGFNVTATKDGSNKSVAFNTYTISTIEPWKWYYVDTVVESAVNLCETKAKINLSIKSVNAKNSNLFIQKDSIIYFTCSNMEASGSVQNCTVHYIP